MKYQLVLQFTATSETDYDDLVALEDALIEGLPNDCEIDGHDFGLDEFNIFLFTNDPNKTFADAQKLIERQRPGQQLRAAYRRVNTEIFVIVWPLTLKSFRIS